MKRRTEMALLVLAVIASAIWYGASKSKTASRVPTSNTVANTNGIATKEYHDKYTNPIIGLSFAIPNAAVVKEETYDAILSGKRYTTFTLLVEDSVLGSTMTISNADRGFESETVVQQGETKLKGKPVRWEVSEGHDANSQPNKIKRYLFYPLNNGTRYETYRISFPVNSASEEEFFENVVSTITFQE